MKLLNLIIASLTLLSLALPGECKEFNLPAQNIQEFKLDNGLKLIVRPDRRAPVVVVYTWYRIGSADEPGGLSGISHILEHMMFKGTTKHPQGEFSRIIARNGGRENAFTSSDYTGYYQELAAEHLALSFQLESDRMQNLIIKDQDYRQELEVVKEERRMRIDDNPQALTYERFNAAAHLAHPYHHLTIGWMNDLNHITSADVKRWYQQWYAPNNAIVVVVGNVDPKQTYQLAKRYFGPVPAKSLPSRPHYREPKPLGQRQLTVHAPAKLPMLLIGYNVPSFNTADHTWEVYALNLLNGILSSGQSARFARRLVRDQHIALDVSASYDLYSRYDSLFTIQGTPSKNTTNRALIHAIEQEIHKLQTTLITPRELQRIKAQILAQYVYAQDSLSQQAQQIGALEVNGISWHEITNYIKNIRAIRPQQIKQVAQRYLTAKRQTIALLQPLPLTTKTKKGVNHVH
jgi:zinc protease